MSEASNTQIATLTARAVECMRVGRWDLAEQTVGQLLRLSRRDPDGLHMMGLVRAHQGQMSEAEAFYRQSIKRKPGQAVVHLSLARLLAQTGRTGDAVAHLRATIRAIPGNADLYLLLGQLQQGAGEAEFAEKNLRAALDLLPGDPMILRSLAMLFIGSGRAGEAEAILRDALGREPAAPARAAIEQMLASLPKPG